MPNGPSIYLSVYFIVLRALPSVRPAVHSCSRASLISLKAQPVITKDVLPFDVPTRSNFYKGRRKKKKKLTTTYVNSSGKVEVPEFHIQLPIPSKIHVLIPHARVFSIAEGEKVGNFLEEEEEMV